MTRMKHLLRKLHIGADPRPPITTNPDPSPPATSVSPTPISSSASATAGAVDAGAPEQTRAEEFSFLEEEFQVQLALAISASDQTNGFAADPESVQIDAAKRMSLGCSASAAGAVAASGVDGGESFVDFLSLRYWNYNFVNYDENVMDGFYDVYGITSRSITEGKMPTLAELQTKPITDKVDYEVILVNRSDDSELQQLEQRTYLMSVECEAAGSDPISNGLIQKIADLVVGRMDGPVTDADEMLRKWIRRRCELRNSINSIVLPLGCVDVGLSRHRALLFKVLADKVNLPCMLVKGSYYTGTDEGAVNLIKTNNGSEYIIDLMGAPGTLIPSEASYYLPNSGLDTRVCTNVVESPVNTSQVAVDIGREGILPKHIASKPSNCDSAQAFIFEHDFGRLPPLPKSRDHPSGLDGRTSSSAQKMKVQDVSECVISAAKNPGFAQRLHAVLLENGASPPIDLLVDLDKKQEFENGQFGNFSNNPEESLIRSKSLRAQSAELVGFGAEQRLGIDQSNHSEAYTICPDNSGNSDKNISYMTFGIRDDTQNSSRQVNSSALNGDTVGEKDKSCQRHQGLVRVDAAQQCVPDGELDNFGNIRTGEISEDGHLRAHCETISSMLRGAEWEIQWEDLHIGDRIGIGSYGEVFHADLNGTEVAVKRFLDQDLTGDALQQFKCEVEIMLRLRHPNVVLFMGAVTRPPNLSILTEYLPRGSLYRLLHHPYHHIDERRRIRMALDVAKGMNYLHTSHPTIVHRDLKSPNLLVDKNWVVKVCDFGLSRMKHQTFLSSKSTAGTPEWMAPEVLKNEPSNEKSDVFSFGVILWELLTLRVPWHELNAMQVVGAVGFQNRRLEIPADADPSAAQLISDCWQNEQQLRPSFAHIMQRLKCVARLHIRRAESTSQTLL